MAQKTPHIIFIMSDQQRGDALGCMGNPAVYSPHIDTLARQGTLFFNGYASTPSSTPARAGLLTGLSPWHHGMLGYGQPAPHYKYEMPDMLRQLGYFTFGIGKMHWHPQRSLRGFHGALLDESGRVESEDFISDYRLWFQIQAPGKDPDATAIGWNDHGAGVYKLDEKLHPTYWTGQMAKELIRNYDDDRPLFLKVSFARPHSPYDPPQRWLDQYTDREIPAPFSGNWSDEYATPTGPSLAARDAPFGNFGIEYAQNSRRHYYASISFIDEQVGEIIQALKEKGMYDNALICYTSDHGDMLGDHYRWRKTYPYEGSTHVPFIIKWPSAYGYEKNLQIDDPVELRDFLPTFIHVGQGNVPEDMDGKPLTILMEGGKELWREYIDLEHATCYSRENYWCALTDGKIKYVWNFYTGKEEFFDLINDPHELVNKASDKKYKKQLEKMRKAMVDHLSERGESFVKDGTLQIRKETLLYSPHYPGEAPQAEIILVESGH